MSLRPIVVTSAFPFAPTEIGVPHFASTYLPADAYARFERCLGNPCVHVSATDVHSIYTSRDGVCRDETEGLAYDRRYREQFRALGVDFAAYLRTDEEDHVGYVTRVLSRMHAAGLLYERPTEVLRCGACRVYLPRRLAADGEAERGGEYRYEHANLVRQGRCAFCGGREIVTEVVDHWYLRIGSAGADVLPGLVSAQVQPDVREYLEAIVRAGVPDWNISRDNKVGIPLPFDSKGRTLYLWVESLLGYETLVQRLGFSNVELRHFLGKNIVYYHGIVWPMLRRFASDREDVTPISARGFMDLKNSSPEFADFDALLARYPRDYVRFYVLHTVPDRMKDFSLSVRDMVSVCNRVLVNKVANLLRRIWCLLDAARSTPRRLEDGSWAVSEVESTRALLRECVERMRVHAAVRVVVDHVQRINRALEDPSRRRVDTPEACGALALCAASTLALVEPLVPELAAATSLFDGWSPAGLDSARTALARPLAAKPPTWAHIE